MKRQWSMIGAILLFLGVAILSVLNVDPVPVNFGFAVVEWPLIVVIFVSLLLGALIATLLSTYRAFKDQRMNKHKKSADYSEDNGTSTSRITRSERHGADASTNDTGNAESESEQDDIL